MLRVRRVEGQALQPQAQVRRADHGHHKTRRQGRSVKGNVLVRKGRQMVALLLVGVVVNAYLLGPFLREVNRAEKAIREKTK